ncbi:GNAT family N-acetyltransferase [Massilia sp. TSP1-1-2]|uniref:GNAT family N-acetyltransferase n=1 Tax=Massilia sp. TSP1-1-2 TaxID=2804649 RepID=UPI003CFBBF28
MTPTQCTQHDAATIAMLISEANKEVAVRFGLNADNCPKHPSFCTTSWVEAEMARGETYFMLHDPTAGPIACVAYERPAPARAYLNRLSVLPPHQGQGAGAHLVAHVVEQARRDGVASISIGVIGEHLHLQRWYNKLGFVDGETKRFAHLPFSVKYMTLAVPD